jgi:hypothetical protein
VSEDHYMSVAMSADAATALLEALTAYREGDIDGWLTGVRDAIELAVLGETLFWLEYADSHPELNPKKLGRNAAKYLKYND